MGKTSSNLSGNYAIYGGSRHPHHAGVFHRIAFYVVEAVEATRGLRGLELHGNEGNVPPKNRTKIERVGTVGNQMSRIELQLGR